MNVSNLTSTLGSNAAVDAMQDAAESSQNVAQRKKVAVQVESVFASMLIKTMRQTLGEEGLFPGDKSDALGGIFDQFMGEQIVQGRGLGIGDMVAAYADRGSEE